LTALRLIPLGDISDKQTKNKVTVKLRLWLEVLQAFHQLLGLDGSS